MNKNIESRKQEYLSLVYSEMLKRGYVQSELKMIIAKTGFMQALDEYPEETLHYPIENSVDEIMLVASRQ